MWPLLAALFATVTVAFRPARLSFPAVCLLCFLSLPALVLFALLLKGCYTAVGLSSMGARLMSFMFALCFLLLSPLLESLFTASRNLLPLASLLAAIGFCVAGSWTAHYSPAHPKPSMLSYALDAGTGKALWTSSAARVDPWTEHYVSASPVRAKLQDFYPDWLPIEFLQHEAPALPFLPPQAELLENSVVGETRALHLRIISPRHARVIHVGIAQTEVLNASVNGHDVGKPSEVRWYQPGLWSLDYANPPVKGIDLQLRVQGTGPVSLVLIDRSSGLPSIPGANLPPRPPDSMSFHSGDQTMVLRTFVF